MPSPPPEPRPSETRPSRFFPSTQWSRILGHGGERDLEQLARSYWRPMRAWLATRLCGGARRNGAADDLAQAAFLWMVETRFFERADPSRGRFRAFLKTALANFVVEHVRRETAQKRGGGRDHEPVDAAERVDPQARTPDQELDAAWRRELLERACDELREELEASGRRVHYELFRAYFLADEDVDHAELAARHGITGTDVANWLDHAKRRFRLRLRALVRETVSDADELASELQWLFGATGAADVGSGADR